MVLATIQVPMSGGGSPTVIWVAPLLGGWDAYTATLSGTLGSGGVATTVWRREGDLIRVRYSLVLGSGSTFLPNPVFTLPVTSAALVAPYLIAGLGSLWHAGSNPIYPSYPVVSDTTHCAIFYGSPLVSPAFPSTPFTWAAGDTLAGEFTYRPAA